MKKNTITRWTKATMRFTVYKLKARLQIFKMICILWLFVMGIMERLRNRILKYVKKELELTKQALAGLNKFLGILFFFACSFQSHQMPNLSHGLFIQIYHLRK